MLRCIPFPLFLLPSLPYSQVTHWFGICFNGSHTGTQYTMFWDTAVRAEGLRDCRVELKADDEWWQSERSEKSCWARQTGSHVSAKSLGVPRNPRLSKIWNNQPRSFWVCRSRPGNSWSHKALYTYCICFYSYVLCFIVNVYALFVLFHFGPQMKTHAIAVHWHNSRIVKSTCELKFKCHSSHNHWKSFRKHIPQVVSF